MISEHKCFPKDWIGADLKRVNDFTYQIGTYNTRQVMIPSGYGKVTTAYWNPDGALVLCSDTNGVKFFFVGSQRSFISYANENNPHDIKAYRMAVEECKRMREEVRPENVKTSETTSKKKSSMDNSVQSKKLNAGLGTMARKVKSSIESFYSVDDSSKFENDANKIYGDYLNSQIDWFAQVHQQAEEKSKLMDILGQRRNKELQILRKIQQVNQQRELKKRIFNNLQLVFENNVIDYLSIEQLSQMIGVRDRLAQSSVSLAQSGYLESLKEVGPSDKFYQIWSEIFYLIEEGLYFQSKHINHFIKLTSKEFGGDNISGLDDDDSIDGFINWLYTNKATMAYKGYDFESHPNEERINERISYLQKSLFLDEEDFKHSENLLIESDYEFLAEIFDEVDDEFEGDAGGVDDDYEGDSDADDDYTDNRSVNEVQLNDIFIELKYKFKAEPIEDESLKPKGFFDFSTKIRNYKVESLQDKRRDLQKEIEGTNKEIRESLLSILGLVKKLLDQEKTLKDVKATPIKTNSEKERLEEKVESIKDKIESIQDDIESHNQEVRDNFKSLISYVNKYNKVNQELFELTSSSRYMEMHEVYGSAIDIANTLSNNVKLKDSKELAILFKDYL